MLTIYLITVIIAMVVLIAANYDYDSATAILVTGVCWPLLVLLGAGIFAVEWWKDRQIPNNSHLCPWNRKPESEEPSSTSPTPAKSSTPESID